MDADSSFSSQQSDFVSEWLIAPYEDINMGREKVLIKDKR